MSTFDIMNWRDLRLRLRALVASRRVERELRDELDFHLEMETRRNQAAGLSPAQARARAQARFGSTTVVADACRDARGIGLLDTLARDMVYALRTFRRAPVVALTVIGTVALGLGLLAAVFTVFNALVFRADGVRDPGTLFAVERRAADSSQRLRFTWPDYDALRRETDVFDGVFARLLDLTSRIDGRMMEGQLVTGNYFQVLGVQAALGRTLLPDDDMRDAGRPVVVISHAAWLRHFARDPNVIGRRIVVSGFDYEIVGVAPETFRGLGLPSPDYWAPFTLYGQFRPAQAGRRDALALDVIGRLKPGLSRRAAMAALTAWASQRAGGARAISLTLEPRRSAIPLSSEVLLAFSPLFFAFGLILMIGCANVANLLLARAVSRQREIGIRLSLGASRRRLIRQLLTENLLLAFAAAGLGFAIARAALDGGSRTLMTTMPPEFAEMVSIAAPSADWRVAVFLFAAAVITTAIFGLLPAMQATRLDLVRACRGELTWTPREGRARSVLIVVQVTASALLLICAGVFLRSALRAADFNPGLRTADTMMIDIVNEPHRAAMVAAVAESRFTAGFAAMWPETLNQPREAFAAVSTPEPQSAGTLRLGYRFVSPDYFNVLDIAVLRGRPFTPAEAQSNAAIAVVSADAARRLWPGREALGQLLRLEPDPQSGTRRIDEPHLPANTLIVVGVVRDVAGFRIAGYPEADVFVPTTAAVAETSLIVRANGDLQMARRELLQQLTTIDPNMGMMLTLRTMEKLETYPLAVAFWLTVILGGLALALTLSGIFSVLSYLVGQRTKEIGVRMALGATAANVTRLVLVQSLRLVASGLAAGAGLAWALATMLMATPAAERIGGIVDVFDPPAYGASLLCIVTACLLAAAVPALRASRIDPMVTLREE